MTRTQIDEDAMEVPVNAGAETLRGIFDEARAEVRRAALIEAAEMAEAEAEKEAQSLGPFDSHVRQASARATGRRLAAAYRAKAERE